LKDYEFLIMVRKLIESDVDKSTLYEVVKTFINDLTHENESCSYCESRDEYDQ
jgi:predicted metal-dependent enzyme (double-stranded beta helix superfamily)